MPNIADLVVKKADGTTSTTWTVQNPGSAEYPASWKSTSVATIPAAQPEFRLRAIARVVRGSPFRDVSTTGKWPKVTAVNGVTTISEGVSFSGNFHVSQNLTVDEIKEAVYQFGNLICAQLVRDCSVNGTGAY